MSLIEKKGFIRIMARVNWNPSVSGSDHHVTANTSPGMVKGGAAAGFTWRGGPGARSLFRTNGRNTGSAVTISQAPEIYFYIGDTSCVPAAEPHPAEPFNVGIHLPGDNTGGTDPNVAYPGQVSPEVSRMRLDACAKNMLRGAILGPFSSGSGLSTQYSSCVFDGMGIKHEPAFNNLSHTLNALVTSMSNGLREGAAMFARVQPADLASGGYRNFIVSLGGVLPAPVVQDVPVVFYRQESETTAWKWYAENDKVSAWPNAVQAMQEHIRMLQRIFEHVVEGKTATSHPEWAQSGVRPVATTSVWLTVEQLESCDEWWTQVVALRAGLGTAPTRTQVIDGAKASEDPVADLSAVGFTQDGKDPAKLYEDWVESGSDLPFLEWLKTPAGGSESNANGAGFLDALKGGAAWVGENVVDIVKDWGATGTLGFLAGTEVLTSDELPPWAIPLGIGVLAFLILK